MKIIYREATPEDAVSLLLHVKTVGGETDFLSYDAITFDISAEREAKFINRFNKSKNDIMFVALDGEKIVGNAIVERNKIARYSHRGEISITVLSEYWGCGIGSRLMEMMIDFAKESGIEILYLEVRSDNRRAISLYEKYGFSMVGIYENFFKIGNSYHNANIMTLNLKKT